MGLGMGHCVTRGPIPGPQTPKQRARLPSLPAVMLKGGPPCPGPRSRAPTAPWGQCYRCNISTHCGRQTFEHQLLKETPSTQSRRLVRFSLREDLPASNCSLLEGQTFGDSFTPDSRRSGRVRGMSEDDAVDGSHPTASRCARVVTCTATRNWEPPNEGS